MPPATPERGPICCSIILSICLAISAVAALVAMSCGKRRVETWDAAAGRAGSRFPPTQYAERDADIRKDQRRLSAIPWLNHWLTRMNLAAASSLLPVSGRGDPDAGNPGC